MTAPRRGAALAPALALALLALAAAAPLPSPSSSPASTPAAAELELLAALQEQRQRGQERDAVAQAAAAAALGGGGGEGEDDHHHGDDDHGASGGHGGGHDDGVTEKLHVVLLLVVGGVSLSMCFETVQHRYHITFLPGPATATLLGLVLGLGIRASNEGGDIPQELGFSGEVFFLVLLPIIIFQAGYSLRKREFFGQLFSILTFSIFGTAIAAFIIGFTLYGAGKAGWSLPLSLNEALAYASILSATDAVAIANMYRALDVDPMLSVMIYGEGSVNDATSIVMYQTFASFIEEGVSNEGWAEAGEKFAEELFGSIFCGIGIGIVATYVFRFVHMGWVPPQLVRLCACCPRARGHNIEGISAAFDARGHLRDKHGHGHGGNSGHDAGGHGSGGGHDGQSAGHGHFFGQGLGDAGSKKVSLLSGYFQKDSDPTSFGSVGESSSLLAHQRALKQQQQQLLPAPAHSAPAAGDEAAGGSRRARRHSGAPVVSAVTVPRERARGGLDAADADGAGSDSGAGAHADASLDADAASAADLDAAVGVDIGRGDRRRASTEDEDEDEFMSEVARLAASSLAAARSHSTAANTRSSFAIFDAPDLTNIPLDMARAITRDKEVKPDSSVFAQCAFILLMGYVAYMASEAMHLSGVVCVLFCGISLNHFVRPLMTTEGKDFSEGTIRVLAEIADLTTFFQVGLDAALTFGTRDGLDTTADAALLGFIILGSIVGRAVAVFGLSALINYYRRDPIPFNYQVMLWHAGLRGAGAYAFTLVFPTANRAVLVDATAGVVLVTVLACGATTSKMLSWSGVPWGHNFDPAEDQLHPSQHLDKEGPIRRASMAQAGGFGGHGGSAEGSGSAEDDGTGRRGSSYERPGFRSFVLHGARIYVPLEGYSATVDERQASRAKAIGWINSIDTRIRYWVSGVVREA